MLALAELICGVSGSCREICINLIEDLKACTLDAL